MSKSQRDKGARFEREVAKLFGVQRVHRCSYGESAPDIVTDEFVVECKVRANIPTIRLMEWIEQHHFKGFTPIVELHEVSRDNHVVMMRLSTFLDYPNGSYDIWSHSQKACGAVRFLEQCEQHAEDGKVCLLVMKEDRGKPVVMLRLDDFKLLSRERSFNCVPNDEET